MGMSIICEACLRATLSLFGPNVSNNTLILFIASISCMRDCVQHKGFFLSECLILLKEVQISSLMHVESKMRKMKQVWITNEKLILKNNTKLYRAVHTWAVTENFIWAKINIKFILCSNQCIDKLTSRLLTTFWSNLRHWDTVLEFLIMKLQGRG